VEPWEPEAAAIGACDCCGGMTYQAIGDAFTAEEHLGVYRVSWTDGKIDEHGAAFDLVLGPFGDGTGPEQRWGIHLAYRRVPQPEFMIQDAEGTFAGAPDLCGNPLSRERVLGTVLQKRAFAIIDAIWAHDSRIAPLHPEGS
jgi:hypothetical protein